MTRAVPSPSRLAARYRSLLCATVVGVLLCAPGAANASTYAYDTQAFTRPSASGVTFWWRITYDTAGQAQAVCFRFRSNNGGWLYPSDGDTPDATNSNVPPGATRPSGSCQQVLAGVNQLPFSYNITDAVSGNAYYFCAKEYVRLMNIGWQPSAVPEQCPGAYNSGQQVDGVTLYGQYLTSQKPTTQTVLLNGGAAYTNSAALKLRVSYQNALNVPAWPATWRCAITDRACTNADGGQFQFDASNPCTAYSTTTDTCTVNYGGADGTIYQCVRVADAAVPDWSGGPPNLAAANAANANLSDAGCDSILLDRVAPNLTASGPASQTLGQAAAFSASATDDRSGPSGSYSWNFGDGTTGSGPAPSHTYATAGTYNISVETADNAGNSATKQLSITVAAPSGDGTPADGGTPPGGTDDPGTTSPDGTTPPTEADGGQSQPGTKCVVPKLKRLRLRAARRALAKAGCSLGKVRKKAVRRRKLVGRVVRQNAKPGTRLAHGAAVAVVVGRKHR